MCQTIRICLFFLLFFFTIFFAGISVYAEEQSSSSAKIKAESLNPGSVYYPLKRMWEKIVERMQFSSKGKISFQRSLLDRRLSELNYVVKNGLLNEVETTSERFAYQAGILARSLSKASGDNLKKDIGKEFASYSELLSKLRDSYPANSSFWMLLQHDINTLSILSQEFKL